MILKHGLLCKEYLPNPIIELSPYHSYGEHKYQMLRRSYPLANRMEKYSTSELQSVVETVESYSYLSCSAKMNHAGKSRPKSWGGDQIVWILGDSITDRSNFQSSNN